MTDEMNDIIPIMFVFIVFLFLSIKKYRYIVRGRIIAYRCSEHRGHHPG
jgi:hypothetical protein